MNFTAIAYFVIAALQILGCYISGTENHNDTIVFVLKDGFKWLLMPLLALFYYQSISKPISSFHKKMFLAIFFSWLGDVFLIYGEAGKEIFFLLGLVSFLIAHVMYVLTFLQVETKERKWYMVSWALIVILLFYMGKLLYTLIPALLTDEKKKEMLVPVLVYSSVISAMVFSAINRKDRV